MSTVALQPPIAKTVPQTRTHLGHTLVDEYAWLQDKNDPEVIAYLEAENAYARALLRHTEPLQEQLFQEMRGRVEEDDTDAPQRRGPYWYYTRMEAGKQYRIFCRRRDEPDAPEEIVLDENALAEGLPYCRVHLFEPSPDHRLLAYSVDTTGAWVFDLYVKELESGEVIAGPVAESAWTAGWANDNVTLFYTLFDEMHRAYKVVRRRIGTVSDPAHEETVYHESDDAFSVRVQRSRSGAYLLLTLESHSASEVRYLPADEPMGEFRLIHPRQPWVEYYVDHHGDRFLIRTNEGAQNFKLMEAPARDPAKARWGEVIPHRADTLVEAVNAFRNHLVLFERRGGLKQIRISDPDGVSNVRYVAFPEPVYTFWADSFWERTNLEFDTDTLRFRYSSLVTPETTVDYDMATGAWEVKKQQRIPSGYDPTQYVSERLHATAPDGTQVPISLVYRRELRQEGGNPMLLVAYGSYGFSSEPGFGEQRLSLLDRGFIFAIAHVRGGSEMGRAWYDQGRLLHKKNSFTDFIACAEHLIRAGYTTAERLTIYGASAGGLLIGAVLNMRPDLFQAAIARVPFTNMITAALMPELPLTIIEYEQWGHPDDPEAFAYMLSYSPYENVTAQRYPHLLVKVGLHDRQVPYWDPAKWVCRLRARKSDTNRLLLVTNMAAGHSGASGRYDHLREEAQMYAFVIDALGVGQSGA